MSQFVTDRVGRAVDPLTTALLIDADDHEMDTAPLLREFFVIRVTPT